jgi:hypothetical protein
MARTNSVVGLLVVNLMVAGSAFASIQLNLHNSDPTNPVYTTEEQYQDNCYFDSIEKTGSGSDIIQISLSTTGETIINSGVVQFNGSCTNLANVTGSNLVIGENSNVTAESVRVDSLTLAAGATLNIGPVGYKAQLPTSATPEPISLLIWLVVGSIAILAYRRHR